jgi:hypothetical protein
MKIAFHSAILIFVLYVTTIAVITLIENAQLRRENRLLTKECISQK